MDMNELIQTEEDYDLQEFFPKTIPYHLQPLMEHRIKHSLLWRGDKTYQYMLYVEQENKRNKIEHVPYPM